MKVCPRCSLEHSKPGTYCSRSCANVRVWTPELNKKRGDAVSKTMQSKYTKEERIQLTKVGREAGIKSRQKWLDLEYVKANWNDSNSGHKKNVVLHEQNYCCLKCGIKDWLGQPLTLELDHINGNTKDNRRDNLRVLCPNCHAQTPTWRGRNNSYTSVV